MTTPDKTYNAWTEQGWANLAGYSSLDEVPRGGPAPLAQRLEGDMEPVCDACGTYRAPVGTFPNYECVECGRSL